MDFTLTEEQAVLIDSARRYLRDNYGFEVQRRRAQMSDGLGVWGDFAEMGWLGADPCEAGVGFGGGAVEAALLAQEFGGALVVEPYIPMAIQAPRMLYALGAGAERIDAIVAGKARICVAVTEDGGRGDPRHVEACAIALPDGGYRLSGCKRLVLGGPSAERVLVSLRIEGYEGVSLIELAVDHPGLQRKDYRLVDRRAVSDFVLDGLCIDPHAVIGAPGEALPAIALGLDHAIIALCAETLGTMEAALWSTRDYLRTRQQFGQPIASFQVLQHRMADMLVEFELARSMLYQGLFALTLEGEGRTRGVAATKAVVSRAGLFVGRQAIQLHGGIGMAEESTVGHYYKRIMANASLFGDADMHLERYSESMNVDLID